MKHVVVSLSGGMDSSTLLLRCLKEYDTVTALILTMVKNTELNLNALNH
jgi:7-cyano-7-deazaguanine synthase in queuosine biosynthesis